MPPGPGYSWLCVLYSTADILSHAARIRVSQMPKASVVVQANNKTDERETKERVMDERVVAFDPDLLQATPTSGGVDQLKIELTASLKALTPTRPNIGPRTLGVTPPQQLYRIPPSKISVSEVQPEHISPTTPLQLVDTPRLPVEKPPMSREGDDAEVDGDTTETLDVPTAATASTPIQTRNLQSSTVPSSRIGRLFHYGGLAASLGYGAASEVIRRSGSSTHAHSSVLMTEANIKRLVSKLSQMRGAALKLGQFLSIQDTHILPPEIDAIFRRVQDSAHYMPDWQMEKVLTTSLGPSYGEHFTSFSRIPFASASIGQVHLATLAPASSPTGKEERVAVKIQFPGIKDSIESDIGYVKMLLAAGRVLPKGLFLERSVQVLKDELADECNYTREASFLRKFASPSFLGLDPKFKVPWAWEGSTEQVLVMQFVEGISVGNADVVGKLSRQDRNDIASRIIQLCLKELFVLRTMQTDPNWTNFLWNIKTRQIELVDFGATREYSKEFMDNWMHMLQSAASEDRDACKEYSLKLGYLTGEENEVMLNAHLKSMILLAAPFKPTTPQPFAFGQGTAWADITAEIRAQIPVMLQHRLTPPPQETYSLNRKLSGAFLLASRLGASVDTNELWNEVAGKYRFGPEG